MAETDPIFQQEQAHLSEIYEQIRQIRDELALKLETTHKQAAQDLRDMSEEVTTDFTSADETMETLAAIETLNSVIDAYNQAHDFDVDRLRRTIALLRQPYFAKVRLKMRPNRPARDVYIGSVGLTDKDRRPLIVDWRSPIAETYYNQESGPTTYLVDGKVRHVDLELRRQFDITADRLNSYFDTTVAIEDSLLLSALRRHHTEKLRDITATIQREQNEVVRHADVPVLLVNGIAGSGKTSVLLQRIAYLFYNERESLSPEQVYLFTPNDVFKRYIDTVLPSLGESNPQTFTWREFVASLGLKDRADGAAGSSDRLRQLDAGVGALALEPEDFREVSASGEVLLQASQVASAAEKFARFPVGPRLVALTKDELHVRLDRKLGRLAHDEDVQAEMLGLDVDEQLRIFGEVANPVDDAETLELTRHYVEDRYASAHDAIERVDWLRVDRIGSRLLDGRTLTAAEWLYLKLAITGDSAPAARYVMVDEVQDYTETQLMVLARYFSRAHFLLLGDENQAIREGTATFPQIRAIFERTHGEVDSCELLTSYRSSPEITALFMGLVEKDARSRASSVHRAGVAPEVLACDSREGYLDALRDVVARAHEEEGLCALVAQDGSRVHWLSRQLGDSVRVLHADDILPERGVVLLDLALAKGLEFDHVVIPDAQAEVYPDAPLARRRLYTALSRAMHKVTIVSQGELSPLVTSALAAAKASATADPGSAAGAGPAPAADSPAPAAGASATAGGGPAPEA